MSNKPVPTKTRVLQVLAMLQFVAGVALSLFLWEWRFFVMGILIFLLCVVIDTVTDPKKPNCQC